jgi:hypothetical protein
VSRLDTSLQPLHRNRPPTIVALDKLGTGHSERSLRSEESLFDFAYLAIAVSYTLPCAFTFPGHRNIITKAMKYTVILQR